MLLHIQARINPGVNSLGVDRYIPLSKVPQGCKEAESGKCGSFRSQGDDRPQDPLLDGAGPGPEWGPDETGPLGSASRVSRPAHALHRQMLLVPISTMNSTSITVQ